MAAKVAANTTYKVFGIRHHGPGSARSLKRALEQWQADCVLVETPADAEVALPYLDAAQIQFPIALLVYNPKDFAQAAYLPYAQFSPEWIAIAYARKRALPIQFMDLPMSMHYGIQKASHARSTLFQLAVQEEQLRKDPIATIAQLAGYTDSERWWEVTFEQAENDIAIFEELANMMFNLRTQLQHTESLETLRREAFMRKTLRKAIKEGHQRIAVVCGAWHTPALNGLENYPLKQDNALLKGIKKVKTNTTWIPWTYERLSFQSGYKAGVVSPAWYELLFRHQEKATIHWMVRAARLLRNERLDTSAAHALEGVRLAETLAALRNLALPGIQELQEAAIATLCEGAEAQLQLIEKGLIVGDKVGRFKSDHLAIVPLQKDLEQAIKTARLTKYRKSSESNWLKATSNNPRGGIDLREESDRLKSQLLHRLLILHIPWGRVQKAGRYDTGSFKEYWELQWKPEFEIRLIEASIWGNTLSDAASTYLQQEGKTIDNIGILTAFIEQALNAHLPNAAHLLISRLQDLSAISKDILALTDALPPLVRILQYGDARATDTRVVRQFVEELVPRICIALPPLCVQLDDNAGSELLQKIRQLNHSIHSLQTEAYQTYWYQALQRIIDTPAVHAEISGTCSRILFEKRVLPTAETRQQMTYMLSSATDAKTAVQWLEGFLYGSGLLLIHHRTLWTILNDWVRQIPMPLFEEIVPLLRRAFANFSAAERTKLLHLAKQKTTDLPAERVHIVAPRNVPDWNALQETVRTLLG
ncbi:MAG: DUF5682 family protein [Bacteroidota bacterium]